MIKRLLDLFKKPKEYRVWLYDNDLVLAELKVFAMVIRFRKRIYYCETTLIERTTMVTHSQLMYGGRSVDRRPLDRPIALVRGDQLSYFHVEEL